MNGCTTRLGLALAMSHDSVISIDCLHWVLPLPLIVRKHTTSEWKNRAKFVQIVQTGMQC